MLSLDRQNHYRERYRRAHAGWQPATEVYEGLIRARLKPGMRLLDLGCGRGGVLEQLGAAVDQPLGIDPDGRSLAEHRLERLPRLQALAEVLPLPSNTYDGVVCSWVLEHLSAPEKVFSEEARVLRHGGLFVCLTPKAHAAVTVLNRALHPVQRVLVRRLYGRAESDTFPVQYKANTRARIDRLAGQERLIAEDFQAIPDPTYLAFGAILYAVSGALTRLTPPVHLIGVYRKPESRT